MKIILSNRLKYDPKCVAISLGISIVKELECQVDRTEFGEPELSNAMDCSRLILFCLIGNGLCQIIPETCQGE